MSVINLAGLLIYRISPRKPIEYLLLNDSYENHRHWYPPKGRTVGAENELKCAMRETMDLTGLRASDLEADEAFRAELKYVDGIQPKQVVYFLARLAGASRQGAIRSDGAGIKHQWYTLEQALERVVYQSMQNILASAEKYIEDMRDRLLSARTRWQDEGDDGWRTTRATAGIESRMGRLALNEARGGRGERQENRRGEWQEGRQENRNDNRRGEWQESRQENRHDNRRGEWQDGRQEGARAQDNPRYKTKLCEKFEQDGECPYNHKCVFAHGHAELRVREPQPQQQQQQPRNDEVHARNHGAPARFNANPLYKTRLCQRFSELGECPYGEKCQFAHGEAELRVSLEQAAPRTPREPQFTPRTPTDQYAPRADLSPAPPRADHGAAQSQTWRRNPFEERAPRMARNLSWSNTGAQLAESPVASDDGVADEQPQPAAPLATPVAQKIPPPSNARPRKTGSARNGGSEKPWIKVVEVSGQDLKEMGSPLADADVPRPHNRAAELESRLAAELAGAIARGDGADKLSQHALFKEITHIEFRNNLTKQQLLHVVVPALFGPSPGGVAEAIAYNSELLSKIAGRTRDQPLLLNAWQRVLAEPAWQKRASEVLSALYNESLLDEDVFTTWFEARSNGDCTPEIAAMRPFAHWLATAEEE